MGLFLIATSGFLSGLVTTVEVAVGLGFLIFVHELGHFLVAKWCGVKCEKFYLGFDIAGLRLCRFRWGETEYGIGILPLGGYVKMLGQDDNPARAAEERERSKLQPVAAAADAAGGASGGGAPTAPASDQPRPLDPRSYMAQSIPERMAIISAGVIMNLIAAVLLAAVAYKLGVSEMACGIGAVAPGQPAYRAGLRPGDRIVRVNDLDGSQQPLKFEDILRAVALGDLDQGLELGVRRFGVPEELTLHVKPQSIEENQQLAPTIGITRAGLPSLVLSDPPTHPFSPAADGKFQEDDRIVAVGDVTIDSWAQLQAQLIAHRDEPVRVAVERPGSRGKSSREAFDVRPMPIRSLGLAMRLGPIKAIQPDSPAASAGLLPGERIESIDGLPPGDTATLDVRLRRQAGQEIELVLRAADGAGATRSVKITPRDPSWHESPWLPTSDYSLAALGVAVSITDEVAAVEPAGPAARAEVKASDRSPDDVRPIAAGERIASVRVVPPKDNQQAAEEGRRGAKTMKLGTDDESFSWAYVQTRVQALLPASTVEVTLADGRVATIVPADSGFHAVDRGFGFKPELVRIEASSWAQSLQFALAKTGEDSLTVVRFIRAIFSRRVSPKNLGGLGTIAAAAAWSAGEGLSTMLLFLTMLSANLAMINILPIPVLDGGHLMFLTWEAVRGKPPNEVWHERLTWLGLAFVLFLIIYSNGLDVGRLFSWLSGG